MNIPYLNLKEINNRHKDEFLMALERVLARGLYLYGEEISGFEAMWARYNGARYCVTTANGLDALTAALISMKNIRHWADKSEVLVSAHTFIASFEAISRAGLTPVPVDVSEQDYLINQALLPEALTPRTVALMPVNIYGRWTDMRPLRDWADKHNLAIISDACQKHGHASPNDNTVALSDATAYSFYPGKNLGALSDAGCVLTNDTTLAEAIRMFCNYGANIKYHHRIKGINSRMDELQAAFLKIKAATLDSDNNYRRTLARNYNNGIKNPYLALPYGGKQEDMSVWHIYPVFCEERDRLQTYLNAHGIGTNIHYPVPPHKQPAYKELNGQSMPVCERLCAQELSLPLNPALTLPQQEYIINTINAFKP